jgi:hypothetical protein
MAMPINWLRTSIIERKQMVLFNRNKTVDLQKLMKINEAESIMTEIELSYPVLLLAAESGNLEFIQSWLDEGRNINERDTDGISALHIAIISNVEDRELYNQTIEFLINNGIDVNLQDVEGDTTLHYAIEFCNLPLMIKLLQHGAKMFIPNNDGITPYDMAEKFPEVLDVLQEYGLVQYCLSGFRS